MEFSVDIKYKLLCLCVLFTSKGQYSLIQLLTVNTNIKELPPGFELGTFSVLGKRDSHYTTESVKDLEGH